MKLTKIFISITLVLLLTFLTQVGGVVFLISLLTFSFINKKVDGRWKRISTKVLSFLILYLITSFVAVPFFAKPLGRVPLPTFKKNNLKPAIILTCLLNRNYVRPELREVAFRVAEEMNRKYPGVALNYLDANFPFINRFPLFPHLSHNDGKKLDVSFQYNDAKTGKSSNQVPSLIGYGICEGPNEGEENTPAHCDQQGYWQYGLLEKVVSQSTKPNFTFDEQRTKTLVNSFVSQKSIGRIFIEPHLKKRLGLTSQKILFHGCHAVRHDDHLHVQIK